jgi:hypothetical protein
MVAPNTCSRIYTALLSSKFPTSGFLLDLWNVISHDLPHKLSCLHTALLPAVSTHLNFLFMPAYQPQLLLTP